MVNTERWYSDYNDVLTMKGLGKCAAVMLRHSKHKRKGLTAFYFFAKIIPVIDPNCH